MNFLLEICLAACIIYLLYLNNLLKSKLNNADFLDKENNLLKSQLTNREKEFNSRESNLNKNNFDDIFVNFPYNFFAER